MPEGKRLVIKKSIPDVFGVGFFVFHGQIQSRNTAWMRRKLGTSRTKRKRTRAGHGGGGPVRVRDVTSEFSARGKQRRARGGNCAKEKRANCLEPQFTQASL